jgi:hypothetical protein
MDELDDLFPPDSIAPSSPPSSVDELMLAAEKHARLYPRRKRIEVKKRRCDECDLNYTTDEGYRLHFVRRHTNHRPWLCFACSSTFVRKMDLREHVRRRHSGFLPFTCFECARGFACKAFMDEHRCVTRIYLDPLSPNETIGD